jgi:hypothetical protein
VSAQIHLLIEERDYIRVEGLPVRVLQVVFLALQGDSPLSKFVVKRSGNTHALVLETFHNCKCFRIMDILHNKPVNCLLILAVDSSSFNKLGFDAGDRIRIVVGIQVDGERVHHFERIFDCRGIHKSYLGVQLRKITNYLSIGVGVEDFAKDRRG